MPVLDKLLPFLSIARYTTMSPKKQINLLRGWPNPSLLPTSAIASAAQTALSDPKISTPGLLYGPDSGYQPLRESISRWLSEFYSAQPQASEGAEGSDRICITGGASQNLACLLQVFTDPNVTRVWMVAPCYFLACQIFEDAGLRTRAVGEGKEGIDLGALERELRESEEEGKGGGKAPIKKPKPWSKIYKHIIYCVPTFSNPSGHTMSLSTRQSLVCLARKYNALIVTDDVYDFLQWPTSSTSPSTLMHALLPRLVDVDRTLDPVPGSDDFGNAFSNGSFSKIAGPGIRTGWAEGTPRFAYGLSQCGSTSSGGSPSQIAATMMNVFLSSGALSAHIETVLKPAYQRRHRVMMEAVKKDLGPLGITVTEGSLPGTDVFGGYFLWIELPRMLDAEVVAAMCRKEENLIVAPGKIFEVLGDESVTFPSSVRLCFSHEEEADLQDGVARLARVVKGILEEKIDVRAVAKQDTAAFQ